MTSRAISVMRQHGLHEPNAAIYAKKDKASERTEPLVIQEARRFGLSPEEFGWKPKLKGPTASGICYALKVEMEERKRASEIEDWHKVPEYAKKQHIRAIKAEQLAKNLEEETKTLKARLKQADNGQGDWVDERDALLRQLESTEKSDEHGRQENVKLITKLAELEKHLEFLRAHPPQEAAERIAELTGERDRLEEENRALREHYGHAQVEIQHLNAELKAAEENQVELRETRIKESREIEEAYVEMRKLGYTEGYQEGLGSKQPTDEIAYLRSLVDRLVEKT